MRRLALLLLGLTIGGAFYLVLIDTTDLPELYALGGVALLSALAFEVSREEEITEATISSGSLRHLPRVIVRIPVHIALVCVEVLAQLLERKRRRGSFRAVQFSAVNDDPHDAGRRALAEALGSLAPNTIVIGVDIERRLLLVHQLYKQGDRDELDVMRLG